MQETIIYFLLLVIIVLVGFAFYNWGKGISVDKTIQANERYMKHAIGENAAKVELNVIRNLMPKIIEVKVAYEIHKQNKRLRNEYVNQVHFEDENNFIGDEELDAESFNLGRENATHRENALNFHPDSEINRDNPYLHSLEVTERNQSAVKTLPERSQSASKTLSERIESAAKTLIERIEAPTIQMGERGRVVIKNPKPDSTFFGQNKIEKDPLVDVIRYYRKVEAGFVEIAQIEIYNLEKGKTKKIAHNNPLILLCGYETCNNVILISPNAHNAKVCGCEDCTKS